MGDDVKKEEEFLDGPVFKADDKPKKPESLSSFMQERVDEVSREVLTFSLTILPILVSK